MKKKYKSKRHLDEPANAITRELFDEISRIILKKANIMFINMISNQDLKELVNEPKFKTINKKQAKTINALQLALIISAFINLITLIVFLRVFYN